MDERRRIPDLVPLTDGTVALRPWEDGDTEFVARAVRDPEIPRWTMVPVDMDEGGALQWVRRMREMPALDRAAPFAITVAATGEPLGCVGVANFDWPDSTAHVFYWLAAEARGRGYATRAVRLISEWAFTALQLERLELYTHPDNVASRRVAERAGYTHEGTLRSAMVVKGTRWDVVLFALLPSDLTQQPAAPPA
jgi:RimJ/RimL family protein N-acetyltransferase